MSEPSRDTATETTFDPNALMANEWVMLGVEYALIAAKIALILVVGAVASRLAGKVTSRVVDRLGLEVLAEKLGVARLLYKIGVREGVAKLAGKVARWFGLVLTCYVAMTQLHIEALTRAGSQALAYLPTILTALAMAAAGVWLAEKVKAMVLGESEGRGAQPPSATRQFLAQALGASILVMSTTLALEHIGVEITLIHDIILGVYGVLVCSMALMFAFGARYSMRQFIAGYYGRKLLRVGDRVELLDQSHGGPVRIKRFETMHILASVHHGEQELLIPYTALQRETLRVIYEDGSDLRLEEE